MRVDLLRFGIANTTYLREGSGDFLTVSKPLRLLWSSGEEAAVTGIQMTPAFDGTVAREEQGDMKSDSCWRCRASDCAIACCSR